MLWGEVPIILTPASSSCSARFRGVLSAELDDDPIGLLDAGDVEDIFDRQRLKVELVRGIVIRAHCPPDCC